MQGHFRHTPLPIATLYTQRTFCCQVVVWIRSFIEPDLSDNNVPFDNTTPIYLINLLWQLGLGLGLDSELHYFSVFHGE